MRRLRLSRIIILATLVAVTSLYLPDRPFVAASKEKDLLTQEERAWLSAHIGRIRFAPSPTYPPISFRDDHGEFRGLTMDMVRLIESRLHIRLEIVACDTWNEILEKARAREVDVVGNIQRNETREAFLLFTEPYVTIPNVIITRKDVRRSLTPTAMKGMRVAIVEGYATAGYFQEHFPQIDLMLVHDNAAGLQAVSFGRIDAMVTDLAVASHIIESLGIGNLHVAGTVPEFTWRLALASRKDLPVLNKILSKGLKAVSVAERRDIRRRWISLDSPVLIWRDWRFYGALLAVLVFASIVSLLWTRVLRTQVKKRTKALAESERQYRLLAENLSDVIWTRDMNLKLTYISPSTFQQTGFSVDEKMKQSLEESLTPDSISKIGQIFKEEMFLEEKNEADPSRSRTFDVEMYHKNGAIFPVEMTVSFLRDTKGNAIGLIGVNRDITKRKLAEKALRESEVKLNRSKKMEAMGLMAGGVAHDLNNVLSGIVSYPELILLNLPEDSDLRKPIETIQESGHRAAAIVQDLLTLARGVASTKEPLDLNELVCEYLTSPEFKELDLFYQTVMVKTNLDDDLFNLSGSHVHIRKVLMNLVSNATEATEGSGAVSISTMNRFVDRPLKGYDDVKIGEYAVLSVSDDGQGISPIDLERIFEPFYSKKKMGRSGTGLGLAVVWNVVQDHEGYIDVKTDKNGTTFELYFPITRDEISDKELSIPIEDFKGHGETILVVDDMETQRDISCKMLDTLGYKSKAISSGEEAIEYLKENTVDLVLLDMIMDPGINGYETYKRIKEFIPSQKAIIVSGFVKTDQVKKAQNIGAGRYLKKPITLKKMGMAIKEELEN